MPPARRTRRLPTLGRPERLDDRISPSAIHVPFHPPVSPIALHGSPPPPAAQGYKPNGSAMDKAGQVLNIIYGEFVTYQAAGEVGTFASSQSSRASISGTNVGVEIRASGDLAGLTTQLKALGMTVTATSTRFGIVEGTVPIAQLPTIASYSAVVGIDPSLAVSRGHAR